MILFISSKVLVLLFMHSERSVFTPTRRLTFLGFVLDSDSSCISPSPAIDKADSLVAASLSKNSPTIGEVGRMLRLLGEWFQASQSCSLGYSIIVLVRMRKFMPSEKIREIWQPNLISQASSQYLVWWINNLYDSYSPVHMTKPDIELSSEALHLC